MGLVVVNLRAEFERVLARHGYDIYYVRRDYRVRCLCAYQGEPNPRCNKCFGTGHKVYVSKYRTWRRSASVPESLVGLLRLEPPGWTHPDAWIYYLPYYVRPKEQDLIIEPPRGRYVVTSVETLRQDMRKVAYYRVVARAEVKE